MLSIKKIFIVCIISSVFLTSCRTSRDIELMKNLTAGDTINESINTQSDYLVKPGDILYISIKSINSEVNALFNPESNMDTQGGNSSYSSVQRFSTPQGSYLYGYEINQHGKINLPILGLISVAGYDQDQLQEIIQEKADFYVKDAVVKVKLLSFRVTLLGEVRSPGIYYNYSNKFTILDAIAMANGHNDFANIREVLVIRKTENTNNSFRINLQDKNSWNSEAFYMHPNDYVIVKPLKNKNISLNSQGFSMFISSLSMLLAIAGLFL